MIGMCPPSEPNTQCHGCHPILSITTQNLPITKQSNARQLECKRNFICNAMRSKGKQAKQSQAMPAEQSKQSNASKSKTKQSQVKHSTSRKPNEFPFLLKAPPDTRGRPNLKFCFCFSAGAPRPGLGPHVRRDRRDRKCQPRGTTLRRDRISHRMVSE